MKKTKKQIEISAENHPDSIADWLDAAISRMRFIPDRARVRRELADSFADHRDALISAGLSKEEASARALKALGDAEETGKLLNEVHSPLLGWAWIASYSVYFIIPAILYIVIVLSALSFPYYNGYPDPAYYHRYMEQNYLPTYDSADGYTIFSKPGCCDDVVTVNGYTVRVEKACHKHNHISTGGGAAILLAVSSELESSYPYAIKFDLTAVDSNGNTYQHGINRPENGDDRIYIFSAFSRGRKFKTRYIEFTIQTCTGDIEWLELRLDKSNAEFSIHIDFEPEADDEKKN